jgi:hypothetical protein
MPDYENYSKWLSFFQGQSLSIKIGITASIVVIVAVLLALLWQKPGSYAKSEGSKNADIEFERLAIYHVKVAEDTYQLGVVLRIYNKNDYPLLLKGVNLEPLFFCSLVEAATLRESFS